MKKLTLACILILTATLFGSGCATMHDCCRKHHKHCESEEQKEHKEHCGDCHHSEKQEASDKK